MNNSIAIIDGNFLTCRAVYSNSNHDDLMSSSGEPTGAIYKVLRSLWKYRDLGDLIVVFDGGHAKFRKELHPEYKKRVITPESQMTDEEIKEKRDQKFIFDFTYDELGKLLPMMGIPVIRMMGEEADDVILRLGQCLKKKNPQEIWAVSDDDDYLQMINFGMKIYQPRKDNYIEDHSFFDNAQCIQDRFILMKSMIGDGSDNIDGVKGVGPAKAGAIVKEVTAIMESTGKDEIDSLEYWATTNIDTKTKLKESIVNNMVTIKRNIRLIDINKCPLKRIDVYNDYVAACQKAQKDLSAVFEQFKRFEFNSLGNWIASLSV